MSKKITLDPSLLADGQNITIKTLTSGETAVKFLAIGDLTTEAGGGEGLPDASAEPDNKILRVQSGTWVIDWLRLHS